MNISRTTLNLKSNVRKVQSVIYHVKSIFGIVVKDEKARPEIITETFDANGYLVSIESCSHFNYMVVEQWQYNYDSNNRISSIEGFFHNKDTGEIRKTISHFNYNQNGQHVEVVEQDFSGKVLSIVEYFYNSQFLLEQEITYYADRSINRIEEYYYELNSSYKCNFFD